MNPETLFESLLIFQILEKNTRLTPYISLHPNFFCEKILDNCPESRRITANLIQQDVEGSRKRKSILFHFISFYLNSKKEM